MANVFNASNERVRDVNRNTFDLGFKYSGTFKFGALYPVFCKEVLSGDSWKIDPTFGFEFLPMVFPVQTKMKANLHFFYVRRRNLWSDFKDYFGALKENLDPPYLDFAYNFDNLAKTGSLGDYMGLPTTVFGDFGTSLTSITSQGFSLGSLFQDSSGVATTPSSTVIDSLDVAYNLMSKVGINFFDTRIQSTYKNFVGNGYNLPALNFESDDDIPAGKTSNGLRFVLRFTTSNDELNFNNVYRNFQIAMQLDGSQSGNSRTIYLSSIGTSSSYITANYLPNLSGKSFNIECIIDPEYLSGVFDDTDTVSVRGYVILPNSAPYGGSSWTNPTNELIIENGEFVFDTSVNVYSNDVVVSDITSDTSPYYSSTSTIKDKQLKISAEPFRAYESIYNVFYRDSRNNPLILNGQPEYNKWLLTTAGGADTTPYSLRYRNWEPDFLTTAVQSPQQGTAPLVGITTNGDMRFKDQESGNVYTAKANLAEDGQTITGYTIMTPNLPEGNLLALQDMVTSGISINDFRNVNALQVWLETNMRKGMTFKDLIKGHFNVDVRFDELDMPEFIGGFSRNVSVHQVTQTSSDVPDSPLGSYAGQAGLVGSSEHSITHFCDEPGYIIGILSITPTPAYSQLLPKHFIKRNILDHFSPEFGHIGFVPIKYGEVCPIQAFMESPNSLEETFGYQRAYYDYLDSPDEVHGLFRNQLRNYLMVRQFDVKPVLSESFLLVDPRQLNEVFASTTESDDKILGQIIYDVSVKRPIPRFGTPRLEA